MEKQNITISLPKDVLMRVKLMAVQRQTSVSSLLTQSLTRLVEQADHYERAKRRHLKVLERGFDLGTYGNITVTRDELHDRRQ
jgi:uncharacterized membrane protein YheB (UPF0754 family)